MTSKEIRTSKKWLTLFSLGCKFSVGALIVFLPKFLVAPDVFGVYAKWLSVCLVGTYVVDFGVSLRALIVAKSNEALCRDLLYFSLARDLILLLAIGVVSFFVSPILVFALLACVLGANVFSVQSISRALGHYWDEFFVNALQFLAIVAGFLFFASSGRRIEGIGVDEVLFVFVVLPRLCGFVYSLKNWAVAVRSADGVSWLSWARVQNAWRSGLIPYAAQGVVVASAMNVDVILASLVVAPQVVGEIKLVTTLVGLFIVVPEIAANYKLNSMVNSPIVSKREYWRLFGIFSVVFAFLSIVVFYWVKEGVPSIVSSWWIIPSLSGVVALRIGALSMANYLTLVGKQSKRVLIMLGVNVSYWAALLVLCSLYGGIGFVFALVFSSLLQVSAYTYLVRKYE